MLSHISFFPLALRRVHSRHRGCILQPSILARNRFLRILQSEDVLLSNARVLSRLSTELLEHLYPPLVAGEPPRKVYILQKLQLRLRF